MIKKILSTALILTLMLSILCALPAHAEMSTGKCVVRLSDDDAFEVEKGEEFTLVFYTAGLNPIRWIWGSLQFDRRAFKAIDGELYVPDGQEKSLMYGDFDIFTDMVSFDLVAADTDRSLYESFCMPYRGMEGLEVNAYVQPIFKVTLKAVAETGEYDISSGMLGARDIDGKMLVDCDKGYQSKYFTYGAVRVTEDSWLPVTPEEPDGLRGDADADGKVTVLDATRIQRYLASMIDDSGLDLKAADADLDGKVTVLDATRIQRVLANLCDMDGITPQVPAEPEPDPDPNQLPAPVLKSATLIENYVAVSWDKVSSATAYRVYVKGGEFTSWRSVGDTTVNYMDIPNVVFTDNTEYTFTVRCLNKLGGKPVSGFKSAGVTVRYYDTPFIYGIVNTGEGIELYWTEVKGVSKYRVFNWDGSGWKKLTDTSDTALLIGGLTRGEYYRFTVRGLDSNGKYMTPYDSFGRMIERDPSAPDEGYSSKQIVKNIEKTAAELGFCADTTVGVSMEQSYVILLDSTGCYYKTNRMEELITRKSSAAVKNFVNMLKRAGEKPSDYCFSIETEPDEDDEIWFYLVVARQTDA